MSPHTRRAAAGGKMHCSATLSSGGPTNVVASLAVTGAPVALTLKKGDLVVKQ